MVKIFITRKIKSVAKEMLKEYFEVDEFGKNEQISRDNLIKVVSEYDVILSMLSDPLGKDVLQNAENLKVISNYAVGINNIDLEYAKSKGIAVYNTPEEVTESTADHTFALLLSSIRKIPESQKFVRDDKWKAWDPWLFLGEELYGKTLGIIGFGRIGKAVARRALGFGLNVIFYDRSEVEIYPALKGKVKKVDLEDLYKKSDYISLHIPLTGVTKGMINMDTFKKMERKPVLINMARGAIVDTDDLVMALKEKYIRGAALDVTDPEPIGGDHPICNIDNCIIVPHTGTATEDCRYNMAVKAAQNIIDHFKK